jgi:hypothetical protein
MIAEIAGTDETDDWKGVRIALFETKVDYAGKRVPAIRVDYPINPDNGQRTRPTAPPSRAMQDQPPPPKETDHAPFDDDSDVPF